MNNQELKQVLNNIDHPESKFLQYITHWINSITGVVLNVIALVIAVGTVIYYDNKQTAISNLILLIVGSYILLYEAFDFVTLEYAITQDQGVLIATIIGSLITTSLFVCYVTFFSNGIAISLFDKSFLLILIYVLQIAFYGICSQLGKLFKTKICYLKNKIKHD